MTTLADLLTGDAGGPLQSDRDDYLAYAQACIEAGKKPMTMTEWVKAGKPKS